MECRVVVGDNIRAHRGAVQMQCSIIWNSTDVVMTCCRRDMSGGGVFIRVQQFALSATSRRIDLILWIVLVGGH